MRPALNVEETINYALILTLFLGNCCGRMVTLEAFTKHFTRNGLLHSQIRFMLIIITNRGDHAFVIFLHLFPNMFLII